jgi:hypothetical protein
MAISPLLMTRNTPFPILHFPMYPKHSQNAGQRPRMSLKFIFTKKINHQVAQEDTGGVVGEANRLAISDPAHRFTDPTLQKSQ